VLLAWRESPGRLTRTDPRYALPRHVSLKADWLVAGPLAGRREVVLWGAGETGRAFARALASRGVGVALFLEVDRRKIGRTVLGAPVISFEEAERARGLPLLVAVGAPGARELIRAELGRRGFVETRDYRCVA
jgi:S-adenosylhomocysteine hydrolase